MKDGQTGGWIDGQTDDDHANSSIVTKVRLAKKRCPNDIGPIYRANHEQATGTTVIVLPS